MRSEIASGSAAGRNRRARTIAVLVAGVAAMAAAAPSLAATPVTPQVKSATAPKVINEGGNGFPEAKVVLATTRIAPTKPVTIVITLLKGSTSLGTVGRKKLPASKGYKSRLVKVDIEIPIETPRTRYRLRICVLKSCRFVPITRMGLPRGYEGTASAVTTSASVGSTGRSEFRGTVRFERVKPYIPGQGRYAVVGGSGTVTLSRNDGDCTTSGTAPIALPLPTPEGTLAVRDARAGEISLGDGTKLVVDPLRPYYYHLDVQTGARIGSATRTCTDGSSQTVDIQGMALLRAGTVPEFDPNGGFERAVRRSAVAEELLGSWSTANAIGGTDSWEWSLQAFD